MPTTETCKICGKELHIGDWPTCPHGSTLPQWAQRFKPVVIFKDLQGHVKFPGRDTDPTPADYERVEITDSRAVARFEREMNGNEKREYERNREAESAVYAEVESRNRSELRSQMQRMSPQGRDFAQAAIDANNARREGRFDPGFHIDAFHNYGTEKRYKPR